MPKLQSKKYFILPLGCMVNRVDAERLAGILEAQGYVKTDLENNADLFAVVACSVRQSAVDRIHGKLKNWRALNIIKPRHTILTGCVLPSDVKKFTGKFDTILKIDELQDYLNTPVSRFSAFQAGIPIMFGCNNFCTYCAVPYTRGRERSRKPEEIIAEARALIKAGYKEITLLGQNVNSYNPGNNYKFADLMEAIAKLPGDFWLRFTSPHPKDFDTHLIEIIAKYPKICKQINLPVQAGSDKILKKMQRPYTISQYKNLVKKIRVAIPEISLSTDTIVGFPGETLSDFKATCELYQNMNYSMAYIAKYSERAGTVAAKKFKDNISKAEKVRRHRVLTEELAHTALRFNNALIGKTLKVLVDAQQKNYWHGRTESLINIIFPTANKQNLTGKFVKVKITQATAWSLEGILIR